MSHPHFTLNDGNNIPVLGLGTYSDYGTDDRFQAGNATYEALKCGYRHIDTAYCYSTEEEVGKGVKRAMAEGICTRSEVFITTKIWMTNMKRDKLLKQAEESNNNLGLGYIDLLLIHWPTATRDPLVGEEIVQTPFPFMVLDKNHKPFVDYVLNIHTESWAAMEEVKAKGIARSIGVSNYNTKQIKELLKVCKVKPTMNQVECNPLFPQMKLLSLCRDNGILLTAYCPLGGGPRVVDGVLQPTDSAKQLREHPVIKKLGQKYGKSPQQICLRFQVDRGVVVLAKSITASRIVENQDIFDFTLTKEEIESLEKLSNGQRNVAIEFMSHHPQFPFHEE